MSIYEKLSKVQTALKAPKDSYNSFGKFNYRSAENIYALVKPLLEKEKLTLIMSDSIVQVGERFYLKATATISDGETNISANGWAREPIDLKGMSDSQITGTASSYARKYALGGLFLIDDEKQDPDSMEPKKTEPKKPKEKPQEPAPELIDENKVKAIKAMVEQKGVTSVSLYKYYNITSFERMTLDQWMDAMKLLEKYEDKT